MKALIVLSGGQDSSTCAFWARQVFDGEIHAVTFDYGQSHSIEIQSAEWIAKLVGAKSHEIIRLGPVLESTSPLVDRNSPLELYEDFGTMDKIIGNRVEKTFVPMRNALFLTIAANRAVKLGCSAIVTGVCEADNANYPDCRSIFLHHMTQMINASLGEMVGERLTIRAPLIDMSKAQSIDLAQSVGGYPALAFTHTAYDGAYPPIGKDHASILRAHGFEEAGLPDPLVIRATLEGLMPIPATANYMNPEINAEVGRQVYLLKQQLGIEGFAPVGA